MATHSRPDLFPETFDRLLKQTYDPLEIVVLVDGGHQDSIALLERTADPRVRWLSTPRPSGMIGAWNRVCSASSGKYFLFCADDDRLEDRAIDAQLDLMEAYPRVAFCHADFTYIDDDGREIGRWESHRGRFIDPGMKAWPDYLLGTRCCMQTTVVRRSMWDEIGGWDEDAGNPGDNSLYLKLLRIGDVGHVPRVTCGYRIRTRQADSWDKQFRNVREFHALATKHLARPPRALHVSAMRLKRRLYSRLALRGIALMERTPTAGERARVRAWLEQEVWSRSLTGVGCRWLDDLHWLAAARWVIEADTRLRSWLRPVVKKVRAAIA